MSQRAQHRESLKMEQDSDNSRDEVSPDLASASPLVCLGWHRHFHAYAGPPYMCVLGCFEPRLTYASTLLPGKDCTPPPSVVKLPLSAPVSPPEARVENYGDFRHYNTPWLPRGQYCRWCAKNSSASRCGPRRWVPDVSNAVVKDLGERACRLGTVGCGSGYCGKGPMPCQVLHKVASMPFCCSLQLLLSTVWPNVQHGAGATNEIFIPIHQCTHVPYVHEQLSAKL